MSKLDILIPLGKSKIDYLDLRYALRSLDKFTEHGDVYIVGEKPAWVKGVKHIEFSDSPRKEHKERNICLKAYAGFEYTKRYLFMNDDHFFLEETDIGNYPNYYKGTCYESMKRNNSHYRQTMNQTRRWLDKNGHEDKNFDTHCPAIMEEERFFSTVYQADWSVPYGYGMKSLYCAGLEGIFMPDKKLHGQLTYQEAKNACEGRHVISCMDGALKTGLGEYLRELLPNKSKYEL